MSIVSPGESLRLWRDPSRKMSIDEVLAVRSSQWMAAAPGSQPSFGFTADDIWIRLRISHGIIRKADVLVKLDNPRLEYVDWYEVRNGRVCGRDYGGNQRLPSESRLWTRTPTFQITIGPGEEVEVVARVRSRTSVQLPLRIYGGLEAHTNEGVGREAPGLAFVGFAVGMFCMSLLLGIILRSRLHWINSVLVGLLMVYFLIYGGYWSWLGLPFGPEMSMHVMMFVLAGILLVVGLYTREFMTVRLRAGWWGRVSWGVLLGVVAIMVAIPCVPFAKTFGLVAVASVVVLWGSFAMAVRLFWEEPSGGNGLLLAGWLADALITSNLLLQWSGVIPFWLPALVGQMVFFMVTMVLFLAASTQRLYGLLQQQVQTSRLERALAESRLHALRHQVNPHFLFNSINSAISLIKSDAARAVPFLYRLAEFLLAALRSDTQLSLPLKEELEKLNAYLAVEKVRFEERLSVELCISPPALAVPVPELILQPLVENAIKHGGQQAEGALQVRIQARLEGDFLYLEVANTGRLVHADARPRQTESIGLANLRERIGLLCGGLGRLELVEENGWVLARIWLPVRGAVLNEPGRGAGIEGSNVEGKR